jgi:hypothetical protein
VAGADRAALDVLVRHLRGAGAHQVAQPAVPDAELAERLERVLVHHDLVRRAGHHDDGVHIGRFDTSHRHGPPADR